ncbi:MAG: hypothetical protein CMM58_07185 [Rhodospirillaceae bacterium]|nr:hypothetical protein [Rhodospirillaceae bacterium]|tara:strand:+ start:3011 stop:3253 length:243 start_codon:yes stop_codon:yes gene_type:complete
MPKMQANSGFLNVDIALLIAQINAYSSIDPPMKPRHNLVIRKLKYVKTFGGQQKKVPAIYEGEKFNYLIFLGRQCFFCGY